MLVLTRQLNESIKIGDEITVTVVRLAGNRVALGIEAPRAQPIMRTELARIPDDEPDRDRPAA